MSARALLSRTVAVAPLLAGAALVPALAYGLAGDGMLMLPMAFHVVVVGVSGIVAAAAGLGLSLVAARRHDGRAVILGGAFAVIATLLLVHALATPGFIAPMNGVVQLAGAINLPIGAGVLALSALPALRRPADVRTLLRIELAAVALVGALGVVALANATSVPVLPRPSGPAALALLAAGTTALALLAWRAARTFLLTRRAADCVVLVGIVFLAAAQYGLLTQAAMSAGFWIAHAFEVGGLAVVGVPVALDLRHGAASRPLVGDLRAADLVEHEAAFLGPRVQALLARLGEKDPSTLGHTRRVAELAVRTGEQLGLPEHRLRQLALGGLLHDMGKLSVPDAILGKPGRLTPEEFATIQRHPAWGRELLIELGGFGGLVLDLVESHHERVDGTGYPNGVPASTLPIEVRILTVADVYDALTADRVYREAWPADRALTLLRDDTGTAFDARCVAALERVVAASERRAEALEAGRVPVGGAVAEQHQRGLKLA